MKTSLIFFVLTITVIINCQTDSSIQLLRNDNYGNSQNLTEGILSGNNIRTRFNNGGEIGHWPFVPSGEWPKQSGHSYLDGFTFFTAAEVKAPGNNTIVHPLEIYYREWTDKDPVTGERWTFNPVPGYANVLSPSPAISTIPSSWPKVWPGALALPDDWNGHWFSYFGKDNFYPSEEAFYVMDDSKDGEYSRTPWSYFPIAEDHNRRGLGLRIEVRIFQWDLPLVGDIIFVHHDIFNISDFDYEKALCGLYLDPGVGGRDDSGDDIVSFDKENNLVYAFDGDGYGIPDKFKTGYMGIALLETPKSGNVEAGLSSLWVYRQGDGGIGGGWPKDDESIWERLFAGTFDVSITKSNISALMGAGPFLMDRAIGGKKHRMASAMIFAQDKTWLLLKKNIAKEAYVNNYIFADSLQEQNKFTLSITNPVNQKELKGNVNLNWALNGNLGRTTTYIYLNDRNNSETLIGIDSLNSKSFNWNTELVNDGLNYKLVFVTFAENGTATAETEFFNINNTGKPIMIVTQPVNGRRISGSYIIKWLTGNTTHSGKINISFKPYENSPVEVIARDLYSADSLIWDSGINTNTAEGILFVEFVTGNDTITKMVYSLNVDNERDTYTGNDYFYKQDASGTGSIEILRINSPEITGDNYLVSFRLTDSTDTVYDVTNISSNKLLLSDIRMSETESPYFEGLRLKVHNDEIKKIDSLTRFEGSNSNLNLWATLDNSSRGIRVPADYRIDFYNGVMDSGYIYSPVQQYSKLPVNFVVTNLTSGKRNKIAVRDIDNSSSFTVGDEIQILEFVGLVYITNSRISWKIGFFGPMDGSEPIMPRGGDVFYIRTTKPFLPGDSLYFSTSQLSGVDEILLPGNFHLSQNYPNPFNPHTKIRYSIPEQGNVNLSIYDVNGEEIAVLVNREMKAGVHEAGFEGGNFASGIYFYVLKYKGQHRSGKMILVK